MDILLLYSIVLIFVATVFCLQQPLYSLSHESKADFGQDFKSRFVMTFIKICLYFFASVSSPNLNSFFEGKGFAVLTRRAQLVCLGFWSLSFLLVPLVFLTFLQINAVHLIVAFVGAWICLKLIFIFFKVTNFSVGFGMMGLVLPFIFADQIHRGLSLSFAVEEPNLFFLYASQRDLNTALLFFIGGFCGSYLLHRIAAPWFFFTWLIPLVSLFYVSNYLVSVTVAFSVIVADRGAQSILMYQKIQSLQLGISGSEKKQWLWVSLLSLFFVWMALFFVSGLFSSAPNPRERVFLFSVGLVGMQLIIFLATMVWGHFIVNHVQLKNQS
ncbi:MAG: hypothetical protein ACK5WZ_06635 [Pseudobdellovibrionaceae bacterium]